MAPLLLWSDTNPATVLPRWLFTDCRIPRRRGEEFVTQPSEVLVCACVCVHHHHPPFSVWRSQTQTDELESEAISPSVFDPLEDWQAPPAVADFLARVGPMMNAQLARNATSHAFDGNTTNTNTHTKLR